MGLPHNKSIELVAKEIVSEIHQLQRGMRVMIHYRDENGIENIKSGNLHCYCCISRIFIRIYLILMS